MYALVARRHMHLYGTTEDHLARSPSRSARGRTGIPRRSSTTSRSPRRLPPLALDRRAVPSLDCCLVSNGGCAVIVTAAERARGCEEAAGLPVGMAQGWVAIPPTRLSSGAVLAKEPAFRMAT